MVLGGLGNCRVVPFCRACRSGFPPAAGEPGWATDRRGGRASLLGEGAKANHLASWATDHRGRRLGPNIDGAGAITFN